jgi:hypothetical protein
MRLFAHFPGCAKYLEYKFSTPPVNLIVYGTEYDKMRQPCVEGHKAIAAERYVAGGLCHHERQHWRMQMTAQVG